MAKRIEYKRLFTKIRVAKPGRAAIPDGQHFRVDQGFKITREGDTVYIEQPGKYPGECVEVPWGNVASAERLTKGEVVPAKRQERAVTKSPASSMSKTTLPGTQPIEIKM